MMDSLAGYDSDSTENIVHRDLDGDKQRCKDPDTNYDDVDMDESDPEMNNNVEEYYSADVEDGVKPEDAPLVFRTIIEPRNDTRRTSLRRSSSDMDLSDSGDEEKVDEDGEDQVVFCCEVIHTQPCPTSLHQSPTDAIDELKKHDTDGPRKGGMDGSRKDDLDLINQIKGSERKTDVRDESSRMKRSKRTHSLDSQPDEKETDSTTTSMARRYHGELHKKSRPTSGSGRQAAGSGEESRRVEERNSVPSFYNGHPRHMRSQLQIQKRRLLWTSKVNNASTTSGSWDATVFKNDFDGKVAEKFKRLMGIKSDNPVPVTDEKVGVLEKQEEMFTNMEAQYQQARITTHTQRGCGLGYGSALRMPIHKNS